MSGARGRRAGPGGDAAARILDAAAGELVRAGAGELSMREVAARAGVSKGLIHYHYRDKDALLAGAAARLGERIAARERALLARATAGTVVEDLRTWIDGELAAGDWRALLSLVRWPSGAVAPAAARALAERREEAARIVARATELLRYRPRVAPEHLGALLVAAMHGMAIAPEGPAAGSGADILILALLAMAE
ncbi:MAG TPA: helix-turn-helix domain-containing protein [Gemmatimonadaceae bacterium]|nr:helix-turn-helix domain-containing protein [Gemmatimonadaceae bacterium]